MRQTRNEAAVKILRETHTSTAFYLHTRARARALITRVTGAGENIHNDDKREALKKPGEI